MIGSTLKNLFQGFFLENSHTTDGCFNIQNMKSGGIVLHH